MREIWKDIDGFDGYQVSTQGRVRTFWKKKRCPTGYGTYRCLTDTPTIMSLSDDGNGYMKVMLYDRKNGCRRCKKVHRLVAEAFIPRDPNHPEADTVDHIKSGPEGKLNNSVTNLQWMPRGDNIRKAYTDGMCDARIAASRKPIIMIDTWTNEECYFDGADEAAEELHLNPSTIRHALAKGSRVKQHYVFEYAGKEEILLYDDDYKLLSWIRVGLR